MMILNSSRAIVTNVFHAFLLNITLARLQEMNTVYVVECGGNNFDTVHTGKAFGLEQTFHILITKFQYIN